MIIEGKQIRYRNFRFKKLSMKKPIKMQKKNLSMMSGDKYKNDEIICSKCSCEQVPICLLNFC